MPLSVSRITCANGEGAVLLLFSMELIVVPPLDDDDGADNVDRRDSPPPWGLEGVL